MPELIEDLVRRAIAAAQAAGELPEFELADLGLERPADAGNGDWTSTVAMRSARSARMAPVAIANAIAARVEASPQVAHVEVAGPGFINFYLSSAANNEVFRSVREAGMDWGRSNLGGGLKLNYEFISANPTGPLHVGHGRWAALGSSMCNLLAHVGYDVTREYYINDHGSQMDVFGRSVELRYLQLAEVMADRDCELAAAAELLLADREAYVSDEADERPETHPLMDAFNERLGGNSYGGDYVVDIARQLFADEGARWVEADEGERLAHFTERAYQMMLSRIKGTCSQARCDFDLWFSERTLYERDADGTSPVERAFERLDKMGYLYGTDDGALWFRSTAFDDDKDRVLIKSNGEYTYFASDVAYHWDKFQRAEYVIDLWGADHHGYIARVTNVCDALGYPGKFEVDLGQFVNLSRGGQPVRMSKRRGTMITFQELIDEVGVDATRYTLVSKSSNQTIDFDIEQVKRQDSTNPVYYVQYAHARICSILRRAAGVDEDEAARLGMDEVARRAVGDDYDLALLVEPAELALSRKISEFPDLVGSAARDRAPFRLTHFCEELAASFHAFYASCQVLPSEGRSLDASLSRARLAACDAVRVSLEVALALIGVSAPEVM